MTRIECDEPGCDRPVFCKSACTQHYQARRARARGVPQRVGLTAEQKFFQRTLIAVDGCWLWQWGLTEHGYASFIGDDKRPVYAHRWSYERFVGPIPEGLVIDHLCRNRGCVRPDHLEPVPQRVNTARGTSNGAVARTWETCLHGHPRTPENTYVRRNGWIMCKPCARASVMRSYYAKKAVA